MQVLHLQWCIRKLCQYLRSSVEFHWMWIFPRIKLTWNFCSVQINLDDSFDSGSFFSEGYPSLFQKYSVTHMHGPAVYAWSCCCMGLISCKLLRFLFMFSIAFKSFSVLPPFTFDSLYQPICQYICGDFNLHHNEWLILVGLIKLVNSCNISVSNDVTKMFNLPTQTPDCDSQSCSFKCISLFWQYYLFYSGFLSIEKCCYHVVILVSIVFPSNSKENGTFLLHSWQLLDLYYHLRDVSKEDIYELSASAAPTDFCELFQVEIDVYTPHSKYQIKPHSFP